jgi:hypothetical protein
MVGAGPCVVVSGHFHWLCIEPTRRYPRMSVLCPTFFLLRVDVDVEPETRSSQFGWSGNHTGSVSMLVSDVDVDADDKGDGSFI